MDAGAARLDDLDEGNDGGAVVSPCPGNPPTSGAAAVASARQTEANRRNARKSTGPVTPEGKRASSRNALKHGLRARTHVPRDDAAEAADRASRWNSALRPYTAFEVWLADQVALESVRVERCQALERDTRARAAARASARWDEDRRLDAERDALLLAALPALTVLQLRRTPQGCDWLAARWSELAASLRQGRDWEALPSESPR